MTEPYEPTTAMPAAGYAEPPLARPGVGVEDDHRVLHPGEASGAATVTPEEPRRHPVAYAALLLSVIALLWLALTSGSSDGYQKVRVGSQDCVSVPQDNGPAALYCRTTAPQK